MRREQTNDDQQDQLISEFIVASWQRSLSSPLESKSNVVEWMKWIQSGWNLLWKRRWWEPHFRFGTYTLAKTRTLQRPQTWTLRAEETRMKERESRLASVSIRDYKTLTAMKKDKRKKKGGSAGRGCLFCCFAHFEFCSFQHLRSHEPLHQSTFLILWDDWHNAQTNYNEVTLRRTAQRKIRLKIRRNICKHTHRN